MRTIPADRREGSLASTRDRCAHLFHHLFQFSLPPRKLLFALPISGYPYFELLDLRLVLLERLFDSVSSFVLRPSRAPCFAENCQPVRINQRWLQVR